MSGWLRSRLVADGVASCWAPQSVGIVELVGNTELDAGPFAAGVWVSVPEVGLRLHAGPCSNAGLPDAQVVRMGPVELAEAAFKVVAEQARWLSSLPPLDIRPCSACAERTGDGGKLDDGSLELRLFLGMAHAVGDVVLARACLDRVGAALAGREDPFMAWELVRAATMLEASPALGDLAVVSLEERVKGDLVRTLWAHQERLGARVFSGAAANMAWLEDQVAELRVRCAALLEGFPVRQFADFYGLGTRGSSGAAGDQVVVVREGAVRVGRPGGTDGDAAAAAVVAVCPVVAQVEARHMVFVRVPAAVGEKVAAAFGWGSARLPAGAPDDVVVVAAAAVEAGLPLKELQDVVDAAATSLVS